MNCKFCGAAPFGYNSDMSIYSWQCETREDLRGRPCYERQLSQQADLLERAMGFLLRIIAEEVCTCPADSKNCVIEEARKYIDNNMSEGLIKEWEEKHGKP